MPQKGTSTLGENGRRAQAEKPCLVTAATVADERKGEE